MDVLGQLQVRKLTFLSVGIAISTILACYGLAAGLGHVPAWLPMISDCAVQSPERYPFRLGIISGAVLMATNIIIMYTYLSTLQPNSTGLGAKYDSVSAILGCVASLGLATVGAVNEVELRPVHDASAVVFFALYQVYMMLVTVKLWRCGGDSNRLAPTQVALSLRIKIGAVIVSLAALLTLVVLAVFLDANQTYIAMMEWLSTFCVQAFNLSYCIEFTNDLTLSTIFYPPTLTSAPWRQMALARNPKSLLP